MTERLFTVPLLNVPQRFDITIGGRRLNMACKWNENSGWVLDIYDGVTRVPLIMNVPLVVGADLMEQFEYIGIPGRWLVSTDGAQYDPPTLDNLGTESNLYVLVDV